MENHWLPEAVSNNAAWCDAISASHGISAQWSKSTWSSAEPMPPFYPNIVTLESCAEIDEQISAINARLSAGWGIKDSFKELELEGQGFSVAFEAHWYCRAPYLHATSKESPSFRVQTVTNESELSQWAAAWGETTEIFKPALLLDAAVSMVYVEQDGKLVSGLATNQSGDSVGISNAFGLADDILGCIDSVSKKHPTKGIVGYGSKAEVAALSRIGFQTIGDLQIWIRN